VPGTPPVVLLVDDHPDSIEMYAIALLTQGFEPVSADNADEAFARACARRPDVIVTDMTLPGASGLELTRRLREDRRTRDAGIIVLTGDAGGSTREQASDAGCDRFLLKPCLPDALGLEIRDLLVTRRTAAQPR
jgi:two-component system cell cycle response regulator DivK